MEYKKRYLEWLHNPMFDGKIREELRTIEGKDEEIESRFGQELEFGTGGLRGLIGAGTNYINKYTVGKATQGFAYYLLKNLENVKSRGVVVAYDPRHQSLEFAEATAMVLCANGIKTFLFDDLRPTPELSFAVREIGCAGGVVITASHNPSNYNGYKVYGEDGGQCVTHITEKIIDEIKEVDYQDVMYMDKHKALEDGLLTIIGEEIDAKYVDQVKHLVLQPDVIEKMGSHLNILYTPLHGTGNLLVRRVLKETGFSKVSVVKEQELPDPDFSTVKSPNPEEKDALALAIAEGKKIDADIILGTDPDCDRVGVAIKNENGEYQLLTGNQIGALLIDYILLSRQKKDDLPENGVILKTIVTGQLGELIAKDYNVLTEDTLTGFKFIGEKIEEIEKEGKQKFIFGYEESYGYLAGTFVRDKDAVIATLLICEMAAYCKTQDKNLYEQLINLYEKYGFHEEALESLTLEGKEGFDKINKIMKGFREKPFEKINEKAITLIKDYKNRKAFEINSKRETPIRLPASDVIHFTIEDGSWFCIRPSGTEPKLKVYISAKAPTQDEAQDTVEIIRKEVMEYIELLIK